MGIEILLDRNTEWLRGEGPDARIVVSSRVRLARNLRGFRFPGRADAETRIRVRELVARRGGSRLLQGALTVRLDEIGELDRQFLVERHLSSREHARGDEGTALVIGDREILSLMVNEEDHLRIQTLRSGFRLDAALEEINRLDDEIEERLDYAFLPETGYLTSCPTNAGTGLRASVMLHLPGLVMVEQINQVLQAIAKLGLAVRGLYGEGTEASGNLFQISNQVTLGMAETDIVENLGKVIGQIVDYEKKAQESLFKRSLKALEDRVYRAYGLLTGARIITSKETIELLSALKLGLDSRLIPLDLGTINELFIVTQPPSPEARRPRAEAGGARRLQAELIRQRLDGGRKSGRRPALRRGGVRKAGHVRSIHGQGAAGDHPRAQGSRSVQPRNPHRHRAPPARPHRLGQGVAVNVLRGQGLDFETIRLEVGRVRTGPEAKVIRNCPAHRARQEGHRTRRRGGAEPQPHVHRLSTPPARPHQEGRGWPPGSPAALNVDAEKTPGRTSCGSSVRDGPPARRGGGPLPRGGAPAPARRAREVPRPEGVRQEHLTELARLGKLDPIIGRAVEIERVIQVLCRRRKNNPVLLGEAGVGKTAIVEGLCPADRRRRRARDPAGEGTHHLDLALMVAGTKYRGQFEERIKEALMDEIRKARNVVLFIDELHTIIGAGAAEGDRRLEHPQTRPLARELQCVGATTMNEYRKFIEKDAALDRRFQTIIVEPPTVAQTIDILNGLRRRYESTTASATPRRRSGPRPNSPTAT